MTPLFKKLHKTLKGEVQIQVLKLKGKKKSRKSMASKVAMQLVDI